MGKKKRVFAIGGLSQDVGVEFVSDINAAEEVWIFEQELPAEDTILSPEVISLLQQEGKRIVYHPYSSLLISTDHIHHLIDREEPPLDLGHSDYSLDIEKSK